MQGWRSLTQPTHSSDTHGRSLEARPSLAVTTTQPQEGGQHPARPPTAEGPPLISSCPAGKVQRLTPALFPGGRGSCWKEACTGLCCWSGFAPARVDSLGLSWCEQAKSEPA